MEELEHDKEQQNKGEDDIVIRTYNVMRVYH
jgi:hypothetical protein